MRKFLFVTLLIFSSICQGEWIYIQEDSTDTTWYLDNSRIEVLGKASISVWEMRDFSKPVGDTMSAQFHKILDCSGSRSLVLIAVLFTEPMGQGNTSIMSGADADEDWVSHPKHLAEWGFVSGACLYAIKKGLFGAEVIERLENM